MGHKSQAESVASASLPARIDAVLNAERIVSNGFLKKLLRVLARIPFAENAAAAYFCAFDPATPKRVKAVLVAALAYFVLPADFVPDILLGLGFSDDAAVLAAVIGALASHIRPHHQVAAKLLIARMREAR